MKRVLAGDIGGTKTILRLAEIKADASLQTLYEERFPSAEYDSLTPLALQFLEHAKQQIKVEPEPASACLAIAGPVVDQTAQLTNLPWRLKASQLQQDLAIPTVQLINDFSAIGYGVLTLPPEDLCELQAGERREQGPVAVVGAGTGLGEAYLTWSGERYQVHASEGGHTDFPARSDLDIELLSYLRQKYRGRVSIERVVSGKGIAAIYQFLRDTKQGAVSNPLATQFRAWETGDDKTLDPAAMIAEAALSESDTMATQAMQLFVAAYGAEVGNFALKILPHGGIFVAGGIAAKILPLLQKGGFIQAFLDKGRLSSVLKSMSIQVVLNPQVGLMGAAWYAATLVEP